MAHQRTVRRSSSTSFRLIYSCPKPYFGNLVSDCLVCRDFDYLWRQAETDQDMPLETFDKSINWKIKILANLDVKRFALYWTEIVVIKGAWAAMKGKRFLCFVFSMSDEVALTLDRLGSWISERRFSVHFSWFLYAIYSLRSFNYDRCVVRSPSHAYSIQQIIETEVSSRAHIADCRCNQISMRTCIVSKRAEKKNYARLFQVLIHVSCSRSRVLCWTHVRVL